MGRHCRGRGVIQDEIRMRSETNPIKFRLRLGIRDKATAEYFQQANE